MKALSGCFAVGGVRLWLGGQGEEGPGLGAGVGADGREEGRGCNSPGDDPGPGCSPLPHPLPDPAPCSPRGGAAEAEGGREAGAAAGPASGGAGRHPGEPRPALRAAPPPGLPSPGPSLAWPPPRQESAFREQCQGLLEESDVEEEPGEDQDEGLEAGGAKASATPVRLATVEKKTEQQRRREKAARTLVSTAGSGPLSLLPKPAFSPLRLLLLWPAALRCRDPCSCCVSWGLCPPPSGLRGCSREHARSSSCCPGARVWGWASGPQTKTNG